MRVVKSVRFVGCWLWFVALSCLAGEASEPKPNSLLLAGEPEVQVLEDGQAIVCYETLVPTPPGILYYGTVLPEQELDYPRYRGIATEESEATADAAAGALSTKHQIAFAASRIEGYLGRKPVDGLVVYYRLEVFDPGAKASRHFDRRFRYGKSPEGKYYRTPCIVEGPFVDCTTPQGVIISWRTDQPTAAWVLIGETRYPRWGVSEQVKPATMHEVEITGLSGSKEYQYAVVVQDHQGRHFRSSSYRFRTAPVGRAAGKVSFAMLCDSRAAAGGAEYAQQGVNVRAVRTLLTAALNRGVDLICFPGDLVNGHTASERDFREQLQSWKRAAEPVGRFIPIYETMGNHEFLGVYLDPENRRNVVSGRGEKSTEAVFASEFVNPRNGPPPESQDAPPYEETVFSFDYGICHFTFLNTNYWYKGSGEMVADMPGIAREGAILPRQMEWLRNDLSSARKRGLKHLFVFAHEPAFPNGGHTSDAMYYGGKRPEVLEMRDEFWGILSANRVTAAFFGDEHNYSRTLIGPDYDPKFPHPVWQIISGGAGAPFYAQEETPWGAFVKKFDMRQHWCLVRVNGARVDLEVYGEDGDVIEKVRLD